MSFLCTVSFANNASYITLSNQMARKRQLEVVANNVANAETIGFQQDEVLLRSAKNKKSSKKSNSFVFAETTYRSGGQGSLKITNRPTDLAIGGDGYFKLITPAGNRYTLDGSMFINNQNLLVNSDGYPYTNNEGQFIEIPEQLQTFEVAQDGAIFVDDEEVGRIGVFGFESEDSLIKEGLRLYKTQGQDAQLEEFTIISGALRTSNVNAALAMARMVEMQRTVGATNNVMSEVSDLEKTVITKITK